MSAPPLQWYAENESINGISSITGYSMVMANNNAFIAVTIPQGGTFGSNNFYSDCNQQLNNIGIAKLDNIGSTLWAINPSDLVPQRNQAMCYGPVLATRGESLTLAFYCTPPLFGYSPISDLDVYVAGINKNGTGVNWVADPTPINGGNGGGIIPNAFVSVTRGSNTGAIYGCHRTEGQIPGGTSIGILGDIVVWKYSSAGYIVWAYQNGTFNTIDDLTPDGIVCDSDENIFIVGHTPGAINNYSNPSGFQQMFLMKFNSNGTYISGRQGNYINPLNGNIFNPVICIDKFNNIFVAYTTNALVAEAGNVKTGIYDTVVLCFDNTLSVKWIRQNSSFNTAAANLNPHITSDDAGGIYLTFETVGVIPGGIKMGGPSSTNIVLAHFTAAGIVDWTRQDGVINGGDNTNLFSLSPIDYNNGQLIIANSLTGAPYNSQTWVGNTSTNIGIAAYNYNTIPGAPTVFIRPDAQDQKLLYYWEYSTTGGIASSCRIVYNGESTFTSGNLITTTVSGLNNGELYDSYMTTINSAGESAPVNFRSVRPGFVPAPVTLVNSFIVDNSIKIAWGPPVPYPVARLTHYVVSNVNTQQTTCFPPSVLEFYDTYVEGQVYVIQAVNDPGYSLGVSTMILLSPGLL